MINIPPSGPVADGVSQFLHEFVMIGKLVASEFDMT